MSLSSALAAAFVFSPGLGGTGTNSAALGETVFQNQSTVGTALKMPVHEWHDASQKTRAIIVAVPALIFNGRAYDAIARHFAGEGYHVYSADIRGYGDWLTNTTEFGEDRAIHYSQSKDDLTRLLTALRKDHPDKKIYCLGESLGANIAIWEASTDPTLMDGVITVGMTNRNKPLKPRPHWAITIAKGLDHPRKPIDLRCYMKPVLTEKREVSEAMVADRETTTALSPTDLIKANITNKNSIKEVEKIPRSMPVLIIAGEKDKVQNTRTLHDLMQRIGSNQKEFRVLAGKGHVLIEHRDVDPQLVGIIDRWLAARLAVSAAAESISTTGGEKTETPHSVASTNAVSNP